MRDIILEKLGKMEDLEQRKVLKDIITGVFSNMSDYQDAANEILKERVFKELEDQESKYDIYITVCHKSDVDPVSEFLYPMSYEDIKEKKIDINQLVESFHKRENMFLFTIFLKCDYSTIAKMSPSRRYKGIIISDKGKYPINISLKQNNKYSLQVQNLYDVFQKNEIPWKTINDPYTSRFFDVFLEGWELLLEEDEEIKEIVFDLEEYEEYKMIDIIPQWNIKRLNLKSDGFPMPAIDKVNFEHVISIRKMGIQNGYLVEENDHQFSYIVRKEEELTIVSPEEKAGAWDILRLSQQKDLLKANSFEIACNTRKRSFINKFAKRQGSVIRTKGDIARLVSSFEFSKHFEMEDIEIRSGTSGRSVTYDMNFFISDDIRLGTDRKIMSIKFRGNGEKSFITQDILSFLVSEVQMYFPEYKCEGELL